MKRSENGKDEVGRCGCYRFGRGGAELRGNGSDEFEGFEGAASDDVDNGFGKGG